MSRDDSRNANQKRSRSFFFFFFGLVFRVEKLRVKFIIYGIATSAIS